MDDLTRLSNRVQFPNWRHIQTMQYRHTCVPVQLVWTKRTKVVYSSYTAEGDYAWVVKTTMETDVTIEDVSIDNEYEF